MSCIHRKSLNTESHEPRCGIIQKTWDHAGNILFQWGQPIFPKSTENKVSLWPGRELLHLLAGETISAKLSIGEAIGVHLNGALGQGVCIVGESFCDTTLFKTLEMNYQKITNCFQREEPNYA